MHEPQTVVERESAVDLPVVLHVPLEVVVDVRALDVARQLVVRAENAEHGIGESELRIDGIRSVVLEIDRAERRRAVLVLLLVTVVAVEAGLDRVAAGHFRDADVDVLRRVDVQKARVGHVRRRVRDPVAPRKTDRRDTHLMVDPEGWLHLVEDLVRVVSRIHVQRIGEDHRQGPEAGGVSV
jgi:hypothetical protein